VADSAVTTILASIDAGAERESFHSAGLATLTTRALLEGTREESADDLAARSERLGAEIEVETAWTNVECSLTVKSSATTQALRLLRDVIITPCFPDPGVDRLRDERLAELVQQQEEPRGIADDAFLGAVFPEGSRYALPLSGDATRVEALSSGAVREHHRRHFVPSNHLLIVTGGIDASAVLETARSCWGDWTAVGEITPHPEPPESKLEPSVFVVPREGAPQSELRVGHVSLPRNHPDFYAVAVMNAILGGLFNSRINLNLRERHGYTYGAFSSLSWRRWCSVFEVSTAVRSDATGAAVSEVVTEVKRMQDELVAESELRLACDYLRGVFPIRFETSAAIASAIASRESFGLPPSYFDDYRDRIADIGVEDIMRVARAHLDPHKLRIVAVGDAKTIAPDLERFGNVHILPLHTPRSSSR
jgi:zinc protease